MVFPVFRFFLVLALIVSGSLASSLNVSLLTPFFWQNNSNVSLAFSLSGNASSCALFTNESGWSAVLNTTGLNASNQSFSRAFGQGVWLWSVACSDANGTAFAASNASFGIDLTPPVAAALSVAGFGVFWSTPGSDNLSGFSRWELFRNGSLALNSSNASLLSFSDSSALGNASYAYRLDAVDAAGNRNASSAIFDPLTSLFGFSVVLVEPRVLNVSWLTNAPANGSIVLTLSNGSSIRLDVPSFSTGHSVNVTTPIFGPVSGLVTSCARSCLSQSFSHPVPPTINATVLFYNATYNGQAALLSVRWDSLYGLSSISISSNNSGSTQALVYSTLPGSAYHAENVSFVVNATAYRVVWDLSAVDLRGDRVASSYTLAFNPNATLPAEPPAPNETFAALRVGQELNVSNGYRVRLAGLSSVPIGVSNLLSAVFESYGPSGELEARFSVEENGGRNTTHVAVRMYRVFLGIGNTSYAQAYAYPISSPTPTPTPTLEPTPDPTAIPSPTPEASPTPDVVMNVSNASSSPSFSGRLLSAALVVPSSNGSVLSGYVLAADDTTFVLFNSTYEHSGDDVPLFLQVRVLDPSSNRTVGVARSVTRNASRSSVLSFSTASLLLPPGDYGAEALVVVDGNERVVDRRDFRFTVLQPGVSDAIPLVALLGVLSLAVFAFTLRIHHHRKGLFP